MALICARFSSFIAEKIFTVVPVKVMFLPPVLREP